MPYFFAHQLDGVCTFYKPGTLIYTTKKKLYIYGFVKKRVGNLVARRLVISREYLFGEP